MTVTAILPLNLGGSKELFPKVASTTVFPFMKLEMIYE
jgi:hypothetical protein